MAPSGDFMAAQVTLGDPPQIGNPRVLFRACVTPSLFYPQFTPDINGKRFLFVCPTETKEKSITLLIQWTSIVNLPATETVKR